VVQRRISHAGSHENDRCHHDIRRHVEPSSSLGIAVAVNRREHCTYAQTAHSQHEVCTTSSRTYPTPWRPAAAASHAAAAYLAGPAHRTPSCSRDALRIVSCTREYPAESGATVLFVKGPWDVMRSAPPQVARGCGVSPWRSGSSAACACRRSVRPSPLCQRLAGAHKTLGLPGCTGQRPAWGSRSNRRKVYGTPEVLVDKAVSLA
jgi:hypothetical protein